MNMKRYTTVALAATMAVGTVIPAYAASVDKIVGDNRYETAAMISKRAYATADTVVLVNDDAIPDALAATPYANALKAPILLTSKNALTAVTKDEIVRTGAKKVVLIGGEAVLPEALVEELKAVGVTTVDRIKGDTREETALEIAKALNDFNKSNKLEAINSVAVVNGTNGLADAVSVAAIAAEKGMPIILSNPKKGIEVSKDFIKDNKISNSYIIGGDSVVSEEVAESLPAAIRIEGKNRNDTNARVIEEFYKGKELNNIYVAKDGLKKSGELIDALSVGVLAAKNSAPVVIVGSKLSDTQKSLFKNKVIKTITQVGGNGNEDAVEEIKATQTNINYEVNNKDDLTTVLANANAGDTITLKTNADTSDDFTISTDKAINIKINGTFNGKVTLDSAEANVEILGGSIKKLETKRAASLSVAGGVKVENLLLDANAESIVVINKGTMTNIDVDASKVSIKNEGTTASVKINGTSVTLENTGSIKSVEVNGTGATIKNSGKIEDKITGTATDVKFEGNKTEAEKAEDKKEENQATETK